MKDRGGGFVLEVAVHGGPSGFSCRAVRRRGAQEHCSPSEVPDHLNEGRVTALSGAMGARH